MKPTLLDLFCGGGGAAKGYANAGFDVIGVDIKAQPHYPYPFIQADALNLDYNFLLKFDAIHASPPCQAYSVATAVARSRGKVYPDLYAATKSMLVAAGAPYVIENVPGSPARNCKRLCGTQFGLKVFRHRLFETNWIMTLPDRSCSCKSKRIGLDGYVCVFGDATPRAIAADAMGIDWYICKDQLVECIPPAYTQFIGEQLFINISSGGLAPGAKVSIDRLALRGEVSDVGLAPSAKVGAL